MPIVFNDSIVVHAGKPIDSKFGPYNSIEEANASIPLERRYNGLIFGVNTVPENLNDSNIKFYHYYGGFTNIEIKELLALGDLNFVFVQTSLSNIWIIKHNLGKKPTVNVFDTDNNELFGDIEYTNLDQMIIIFSQPVTGTAILN
jgi:hypothetical protein